MFIVSIILIFTMCLMVILRKLLERDVIINDKHVNILFNKPNLYNCDTINLPCITNDQCTNNCQAGLVMRCDSSGFCARGALYDSSDVNDCDISRGLIVVLSAVDGLAVQKTCVSLYRDVIEDNGDLKPYVCEGGNMLINLENGPFSVEDCLCAPQYTKFSYNSGAFTRNIPVCIPNKSADLYKRIYQSI